MKLKDGFVLHETEGEYILVATGVASESFNGYIRVNHSGAFMIERMMNGISKEDLIDAVVEHYEVEKEVVEKDLAKLVETLTSIHAME